MNKIFIGSSSKAIDIANAVQNKLTALMPDFQIVVWTQNVFVLSRTNIETLIEAAKYEYKFAVFIFAPDDLTKIKRDFMFSTRDNVIFEYGLFTGSLNRDKVFALTPSGIDDFRIPTDILGVTTAYYDYNSISPNNILDIIHKPCLQIKHAISNIKPDYSNVILGSYSTPREHYKIANLLLINKDISEIILVQKSSTIILGYEKGDQNEKMFADNLINCILAGCKIYHITDTSKIKEKKLSDRSFINTKVKEIKDLYIKNKTLPIRLPKEEFPQPILIVKYKNYKKPIEGIILSHTGISEACLFVRGKMMKKYWDTYLECYYNRCLELNNSDLIELINYDK